MISEYLKERVKWKKFGSPTRTEEQMDEIFAICNECPMYKKFNETSGECGVCGCGIKKYGSKLYRFLNKIFWGTTRCPLPEPKWVESETRFVKEVKTTQSDLEDAERQHQKDSRKLKQKKKKPCNCNKKKR